MRTRKGKASSNTGSPQLINSIIDSASDSNKAVNYQQEIRALWIKKLKNKPLAEVLMK